MKKPVLLWPHLLCAKHFRDKIQGDVDFWVENLHMDKELSFSDKITVLLTRNHEFRNLFYYRIGPMMFKNYLTDRIFKFMKFCVKPLPDLFLWTPEIGEGLFIQHGNGTFIGAQKIGKYCHIHHQVSIGFKGYDNPVIGDHVYIGVGAKIIGGVKIGNHVKIGANAVVVKDVPDNCTVVGVPAKIVKQNGKKVEDVSGEA